MVIGICLVFLWSAALGSPGDAQAKTRVEANIFYPDSVNDISKLTALQQELGVHFSAANWYMDWATDFDPATANRFQANGFIPELTWEPQLNGTGVSYDQVVGGTYDSYLTHNAQIIRSLGYPIRISLAPEMNTDWTPWGMGKQGNNRDNHKAFWHHVVELFRAQGATNVQWVWSPNVRPWNATQLYGTLAELYPGDGYVDFMGLDGYNWGTSQSWSVWQSFSQVFEGTYNELISFSAKNILIMEVASAEAGGDKAAWITDMFSQLGSRFSHIQGFTWFNINKETDWRIKSSVASTQSFTNGYLGVSSTSTTNGSTSPAAKTTTSTGKTTKPTSSASQPATDGASGDPAVTTPDSAITPEITETKYPATLPIEPKIAGVRADQLNSSAQQFLFMSVILLGLTLLFYLTHRRYQLIHAPVYADSSIANYFGFGYVDSVIHPRARNYKRRPLV